MRASRNAALWTSLFVAAIGCGGKSDDTGDDDDTGPDACVGIECQVVDCAAMGQPNTSISGTVFAPNGTLPLNGVTVYVNRDPLPPFTEGVQCDRCNPSLPGSAVAQTISDAAGNFKLDNVPVGDNIPLVITTGKWRRQITIPTIAQCANTDVGAAETRLPKNKSEGNIPKIALTTGEADSLECLVRKLGIDDSEISPAGGSGRIHFYNGNGVSNAGGNLTNATDLWNTTAALSEYDIAFFSCEGAQRSNTKGQGALNAVRDYAAVGGRVFMSHWHNIWVGGNFQDGNVDISVPEWRPIAQWTAQDDNKPGNPIFIDEVSNPKGTLFADWMVNVGGSQTRGQISQTPGTLKRTALSLDTTLAERWVQTMTAATAPAVGGPQMFQFTTPTSVTPDQRCGKVVYTDMHVSGDGDPGGTYPNSCDNNLDLSAQEKALAFMFFDIGSCVGGLQ